MAIVVDLVGLAAGLDAASVPWRELADEERSTYAVDDVQPTAICWPETYEQAARALGIADRLGLAVAPRGAGTKLALGNVPHRCDLIVSTARLDRIVEYAPANLTVIAQAGVSLKRLQSELAPARQCLPLDPPNSTSATLGGIIAANSSGPRRLGYGTARDLVIGTAVATTSGAVTRAGGRVVKNVAGYDLNKLYIGSLGTLALVVEVGFKIAPVPAAQTTVIGQFDRIDRLAEACRLIRRSPFAPVALDLFDPAAFGALDRPVLPALDRGYALAVLGAAPGRAVARQATEFARVFRESGATRVDDLATDESESFWSRVADRPSANPDSRSIQLKLTAPPAHLAGVVESIEAARRTLGPCLAMSGRAGNGVILVDVNVGDSGAEDTVILAEIERLRGDCHELAGGLVVERCPPRFKARIDVWGDVGTSLGIMRKLKMALDPGGTLNRGRFVGGI